MTLLVANTTDASNEKHVPMIVDKGDFIEVSIGSVEHPMEEKHHIVFIEVLTKDRVCRKFFEPTEKPFARFSIKRSDVIEVREFCNLHRLWKA
jgi:superoxide reductase